MPFTKQEIEKMQSIFKHLQPTTIESLQYFSKDKVNRTNATFGVKNHQGKYIYIFQYFENLSKARIKILDRRKKEIPYPINIVQSNEKIVCIGWKSI